MVEYDQMLGLFYLIAIILSTMEYVVAALVIENVAQFKVGLFFPTKIRCFEWRSCQMFFGETAADRSRRQTSGLLQLSEVCRMLFSTNYVHTIASFLYGK